jgi:hypothetical protein
MTYYEWLQQMKKQRNTNTKQTQPFILRYIQLNLMDYTTS